MTETKIYYKNLSVPLKIAYIISWTAGSIYALSIFTALVHGFIDGFMTAW